MERLNEPASQDALAMLEDPTQPSFEPPEEAPKKPKYLAVAILLVLALLSAGPLASFFSQPETYARTVASLDARQAVTTDFMLGTAAASVAMTVLGPEDWGVGVANELADISGSVAIVLAAILLEKYALTVIGLSAFRVIIPLGLVLLAIGVFMYRRPETQAALRTIGAKMVLFAVAISICIPLSMLVSNMVEDAYNVATDNRIQSTVSALQTFASVDENSSEQGILEAVGAFFCKAVSAVANLPQAIQSVISGVVETFAMLVVLNCIVPILTVLACLWMTNLLLGTRIPIPRSMPRYGSKARTAFAGKIGRQ